MCSSFTIAALGIVLGRLLLWGVAIPLVFALFPAAGTILALECRRWNRLVNPDSTSRQDLLRC